MPLQAMTVGQRAIFSGIACVIEKEKDELGRSISLLNFVVFPFGLKLLFDKSSKFNFR